MSLLRELIEYAMPVAYADEPEEEENDTEEAEESTESEESEESEETESSEDGDDDEEEDEDEDDDEDDEEEKDPLDTLREECIETTQCHPFNHHFQECIERVTKEMEEEDYEHKDYKEDCVEEFFHLQHCVNDCVAPRLFAKLK